MSDQWTAFIEAKLDDLELASRSMVQHLCDSGELGFDLDSLPPPVRWYLLRVTPARTDAVVAGLRQILAGHEMVESYYLSAGVKVPYAQCLGCRDMCHSRSGLGCDEPRDAPWPCETVRSLASIWAVDTDHPEFREEAR